MVVSSHVSEPRTGSGFHSSARSGGIRAVRIPTRRWATRLLPGESKVSESSERTHLDPWNSDWAVLLKRIAAGEEGPFDQLYDESSSLIYGVIYRVLRDREAAEEVTLDVYLQIWRDASRFDASRGRPVTWMTLLARSRAIDRRRSSSRTRRREDSLELAAEASDERAGPEAATMLIEAREQVRSAMTSLSEQQRELIELAWFAGLSHSQIAEHLEQPLGTVKTRIRNGMANLRQVLEPSHSERGA